MKQGCFLFILWVIILAVAVVNFTLKFGIFGGVAAFVLLMALIVFLYRNSIRVIIAQMTFDKDHQKGFMWFEKAYKTGKMKTHSALFYAYLLLRDGKLQQSEKMINDILMERRADLSRQDYLNAKLNRALIKWKAADIDAAIEMVQEIYDENFRTTAVYGVLGYLYIEKGEYEKAMEINKEAVEYNSDDNIIMDNYALNFLCLGDIKKSEELYLALLEKEPDFIEPYYNYGTLLEKRGDKDTAREYYNKALTYREKFLSTVSHEEIRNRLDQLGD